ncbi:hypothetical protein J31TS6_45820 [Brevibacillus reuszeri]|uniref:hypothetical protein n=1 Tax=Brevibacillus reuszeri TaxID=54915 RepID=UPI001B0ED011|nr:hypothetical protein [Brevibacillus reuszeri]GIO08554.1 hypothetical protein J31TS6_45820 [Brevibacillus reuszeri]
MTLFDVGLVHRLADQMEGLASNIKKHVNSPNELSEDIKQMKSILNSFQTITNSSENSGTYPIANNNDVR